MTYDLRRLRLHGLIDRLQGRNRYTLTADGLAFALFYTKLGNRVLPPLFGLHQPNRPPKLARALNTIDRCVNDYVQQAELAAA